MKVLRGISHERVCGWVGRESPGKRRRIKPAELLIEPSGAPLAAQSIQWVSWIITRSIKEKRKKNPCGSEWWRRNTGEKRRWIIKRRRKTWIKHSVPRPPSVTINPVTLQRAEKGCYTGVWKCVSGRLCGVHLGRPGCVTVITQVPWEWRRRALAAILSTAVRIFL